jgi:meso-butanediol dehydrogenase / (S,S)-butanediol dehydrogenase / diacetyl reductase
MVIDTNEFAGKAALVTGTTGIGRAIALRLADGGAQVTALGIDEAANRELASMAKERGLTVFAQKCDVSDAKAVGNAVAQAAERMGGIDILVNAAAIHPFGDVVETEPETWSRCMAINLGSVYLMAHAAIPEMKKRGGGCILNLASVQGYACQKGVAAYAASKGAIHSLTRAMALDHARDRIRVNSISPGSVRTPMLATSAAHFSPGMPTDEVFARFGAAHPIGRIGAPEEIAELAAFLASDRGAFCTGSDFVADGGLLAGIGVS